MTYAEFGRRARENQSNGTAVPHFVAGGRVRGGLYGGRLCSRGSTATAICRSA
ncbi:MAG: Protein of unknown function (DUF1501) [uncultured Paraburkholderia sp.]|nr:MAG: Protein of unknown function (DUF1501) [uncultured Paraburkholderia sp.]CAH2943491.1 MAG: Protein of unknown function (DUF1501) [uncultured Paraburkholderia sp.]